MCKSSEILDYRINGSVSFRCNFCSFISFWLLSGLRSWFSLAKPGLARLYSHSCVNGSTSFGIPGVQGRRYNNSYCRGSTSSWTGPAVGPWTVNAPGGDDSCSVGTARGCCRGHAIFPGGGGHSPFNDGGCCWGGFGQGGLVVVSYWE